MLAAPALRDDTASAGLSAQAWGMTQEAPARERIPGDHQRNSALSTAACDALRGAREDARAQVDAGRVWGRTRRRDTLQW